LQLDSLLKILIICQFYLLFCCMEWRETITLSNTHRINSTTSQQ